MTVNKLTLPSKDNAVQSKINEIIDNLGSGLQNTATGTNSLTILGTATTDNYSIAIGDSSNATRSNSVAIGNSATTISQESVAIGYGAMAGDNSNASDGAVSIGYNAGGYYSKGHTISIGNGAMAKSAGGIAIGAGAEVGNSSYQWDRGIAIGRSAEVYGSCAIQLGTGTNTTSYSMSVGFDDTAAGGTVQQNWNLLDGTTGLIPDARISSNIARTSQLPSKNIGELVHSLVPLTDAGLHLLDGAWIDANGSYADFVTYILGLYADYPDLFTDETGYNNSITNYGVCGKFYYDQTNQRLRLPKITGIIEGTVDATALGDLVQAGLPNITGNLMNNADRNVFDEIADGCFTRNGETMTTWAATSSIGATGNHKVTFDASASNSIYGNSTTVQPQTIKAFIYIVVANSTKTAIQVDIDEIATDLNGKADTDLANLNNTGSILIAHNAMPSNTSVSLTLGVSGTSYTAPSDGWVAVIGLANAAGDYIVLQSKVASSPIAIGVGQYLQTFIPVSKGDTFVLYYNTSSTSMTFYYANGSVSEYTP